MEATSTRPCVGAVARFPWATQVRLALRAALAPLFRRLNRPGTRLQCLGLGLGPGAAGGTSEELPRLLEDGLVVQRAASTSHVQHGWRVCEVGKQPVSSVAGEKASEAVAVFLSEFRAKVDAAGNCVSLTLDEILEPWRKFIRRPRLP